MTPTLEQLLPRNPCCCDAVPADCGDCPEDLVSLCYRVRRAYPSITPDEAWPEGAESLWMHIVNVNARCGEAFIVDQLGCRTDALEAWSFDDTPATEMGSGDWAYGDHDYYANVRRGTSDTWERVTPVGWPYKLAWSVEGLSCSIVKVDMIGGVGDYAGIGEGGPPVEELSEHSLESIESLYLPAVWPEVFRIGQWEFTRSTNCITPVAGPTCFRVTGGEDETDVVCATHDPHGLPLRLNELKEFENTQASCFSTAPNDSFGGNLVDSTDTTTARVWWRINAARTHVQVHFMENVADESEPLGFRPVDAYAWIPYTPTWWVGGIAVGDYTLSPCDTNCIAIACLPPCVVQDCNGLNRARPLNLTVTGCPDLAALAPATFPTVDGGGFQSGTFGYGPTSPPGEPPVAQILIQYSCSGGNLLVREVFVLDTDAAEFTLGPTVVSNACSGGSWADSFSVTLLDCVPTFDVFSDGSDPWEYL